jgi:arylsulfatase A-like enzyme
LIEAEVPLVTVMWNHSNRGQDRHPDDVEQFGWDTHNDIFDVLGGSLLPRFDQSFSALLEDLDQRGLLDSTLVVCMGEFGRAPLVALESKFKGASPGRKHWAAAYSILMAGAGVRGGATIGATDRQAAYPISTKYAPWDVTATIFHALGIDSAGHFYDSSNRPYPISAGQPIAALYD